MFGGFCVVYPWDYGNVVPLNSMEDSFVVTTDNFTKVQLLFTVVLIKD